MADIIGSLAAGGVGAPTSVMTSVAVVVLGAVAVGITGHALLVDEPAGAPGDLAEEADDADPEDPPLAE
ncbi:hypothetical protein BRD05_04055 [Halobacteriales archaeon QS_9_70_65]|nr:MAG: hypothetical protein BRD05_04055 [Halobacteriales archaeon QS_9_70_65]